MHPCLCAGRDPGDGAGVTAPKGIGGGATAQGAHVASAQAQWQTGRWSAAFGNVTKEGGKTGKAASDKNERNTAPDEPGPRGVGSWGQNRRAGLGAGGDTRTWWASMVCSSIASWFSYLDGAQ